MLNIDNLKQQSYTKVVCGHRIRPQLMEGQENE